MTKQLKGRPFSDFFLNCTVQNIGLTSLRANNARQSPSLCGIWAEILKATNKHRLFLVGAFSLKEKSPTITVGSFLAYNLTLNGPLFLQSLQSYLTILT